MCSPLKYPILLLSALLTVHAGKAFGPADTAGKPPMLFAAAKVRQGSLLEQESFVMRDYYMSLDVRLGRQTDDRNGSAFDAAYRYPKYGVGYYMGNMNGIILGADTLFASLGKPAALYAFFGAPVYCGRVLTVGYGLSAGLSYNFNAYDPQHNPFNILIGSRNNAYIELSLDLWLPLPGRSALAAGVSFQHFSNGAYQKPNYGVNLISSTLTYQWSTYRNRDKGYAPVAQPEGARGVEWSTFVGGGVRMLDADFDRRNPREGRRWTCLTLSSVVYRQVSLRRKWGAGVDVLYYEWGDYVSRYRAAHEALVQGGVPWPSQQQVREAMEGHDRLSPNNVTLGLYASHEVGYKRLWLATDVGFYPLPRVGDNPTSLLIYERLGLRVELTDRLFVGVAIRAHGLMADYTEWTVGYRVVRRKG